MSEYSEHDCGGPDVCSGCSSWRHGVYEDGSGDPMALEVARRVEMALLDADIVNARAKVLRAARRAVHFDGARHSVQTLKHALIRFDAAMHKAYDKRKASSVSDETESKAAP